MLPVDSAVVTVCELSSLCFECFRSMESHVVNYTRGYH